MALNLGSWKKAKNDRPDRYARGFEDSSCARSPRRGGRCNLTHEFLNNDTSNEPETTNAISVHKLALQHILHGKTIERAALE